MLNAYTLPIKYAIVFFPFVAALFTLPFVIYNYRKYGSIPILRVIVVYSFILFCICAYFLVIMPLPKRAAVAASKPIKPGLKPFTDLMVGLRKYKVVDNLKDVYAWKRYLTSSDFFQIVANIAMLIPLGFYLRYYFRLNFLYTTLIGILTGLFFEITQYTGIFGIYAHAYRYACTDDVINNALGACLGWLLSPVLMFFLPSRDKLDSLSYKKGMKVSYIRRLFALLFDWVFLSSIAFVIAYLWDYIDKINFLNITYPTFIFIVIVLYFTLFQYLNKGKTLGKALLKIRVKSLNGNSLSFKQCLIRFVYIYILLPITFIINVGGLLLLTAGLANIQEGDIVSIIAATIGSIILVTTFVYLITFLAKNKCLPHEYRSKTQDISTIKKEA